MKIIDKPRLFKIVKKKKKVAKLKIEKIWEKSRSKAKIIKGQAKPRSKKFFETMLRKKYREIKHIRRVLLNYIIL
jgi:hypothetical protein